MKNTILFSIVKKFKKVKKKFFMNLENIISVISKNYIISFKKYMHFYKMRKNILNKNVSFIIIILFLMYFFELIYT